MKSFLFTTTFIIILGTINLFSQKIIVQNISSSFFKKSRSFRVWLPDNYDDKEKYGVIYVLDADYLFDIVVANISYFFEFHNIPPVIVVAVDYEKGREDVGLCLADLSLDSTGVNFRNYINEDLVPFMDKTYSTNHLNTVIGHSYTATYFLHYILNHNNNFQQYVFLAPESPDIAVDKMIFDKSYISGRKFVFVTATGDLERRINLVDNLYSSLIRQTDSAAYLRKASVNASHNGMIPFAIPLAIKLLFDDYLGGENLEWFIEKSSLDAETLWTTVKKSNQKLYNCSVVKNSLNALLLLGKASCEKKHTLLKEIVDELTVEKDANLLEILASFLEETDRDKAEQYYIKSIQRYSEENKDGFSLNARRQYAKRILAPKSDLFKAWKILSKPKGYHILEYDKGYLSAKYNYKNEEGIQCLNICLKHKIDLRDYGVTEQMILFFIAKCYKNVKKTKSAIEYIDMALNMEPENEEYRLFKISMEESENP